MVLSKRGKAANIGMQFLNLNSKVNKNKSLIL